MATEYRSAICTSAQWSALDSDTQTNYYGSRQYTSVASWESDKQGRDYITNDELPVAECFSGTTETSRLLFDGWSYLNTTHYPIIRARSGHETQGVAGNAYKFSTGSDQCILDYIGVLRVEGIELETTNYALQTTSSSSDVRNYLIGCFLDGKIYINQKSQNSGSKCIIVNCIQVNGADASDHFADLTSPVDIYFYNCTLNGRIIVRSGVNVYCKNLLSNATDAFLTYTGCTLEVNYSALKENKDTDWTSGANNRINQTFTFADESGGDYHLASTDAGAKDYGTDLSSDTVYAFSDDIDGDTRSGSWDIGADEYVSVGGTTYQVTCSDGISAGDTPTKRAIFSAACADGVAAGDSDSNIATLTATLADTLNLSDSVARTVAMYVAAADGINAGDSTTRTATYQAAAADSATFSDSTLADLLGNLQAECADGVVLSESVSALAQLLATSADGLSLSDTALWGGILSALAADGITLSDSAAKALYLFATCADSVSLSDAGTPVMTFSATCADSVQFAETLAAIMKFAASVSDGFEISDSPSVPSGTMASGVVTITFNVKQAKIAFSVRRPGISFSVH